MEERDIITLDDKEYFLLDTIRFEDTTYVYFTETTDLENTRIFKEAMLNNEVFYENITSDNEYNKAMTLFYEKHK